MGFPYRGLMCSSGSKSGASRRPDIDKTVAILNLWITITHRNQVFLRFLPEFYFSLIFDINIVNNNITKSMSSWLEEVGGQDDYPVPPSLSGNAAICMTAAVTPKISYKQCLCFLTKFKTPSFQSFSLYVLLLWQILINGT
jgi:hypothetical protein